MPFAEYATHDNRAESSERMDDAAIIQAVVSERETVAVDENEDPDASDSEEGFVEHDGDETRQAGEEEIIKTSTEFLRSISQQKAYILHNKLPKSLLKDFPTLKMLLWHLRRNLVAHRLNFQVFSIINFGRLWLI